MSLIVYFPKIQTRANRKNKKGRLLQGRSPAWPKVFAKGAVPGRNAFLYWVSRGRGRIRDRGPGRFEAKRKSMPVPVDSRVGAPIGARFDSDRIGSVGAIPPRLPGGCGQSTILQNKAAKAPRHSTIGAPFAKSVRNSKGSAQRADEALRWRLSGLPRQSGRRRRRAMN